jgi:hypothetical protein
MAGLSRCSTRVSCSPRMRPTVLAAAANEGRGAPRLAREVRGAHAVAETFKGRAGAAQPAFAIVAFRARE